MSLFNKLDKETVKADIEQWNKDLVEIATLLNKMNARMQEIYKNI